MVSTEKQFKVCPRYLFFVCAYHAAKVVIICQTAKTMPRNFDITTAAIVFFDEQAAFRKKKRQDNRPTSLYNKTNEIII